MWRGQDVHGVGHHPRTRRGTPKHHAGDVPLAYHAQVGARGPADDSARSRLSHRRHAQRRRSKPAARYLRSEAEQRQDSVRGQTPHACPKCGVWAAGSGGSAFPGRLSSSPAKTKASWATSGSTFISKQSPVRISAGWSIRIPALPSSTPRCRSSRRSTSLTSLRSRRR